MHISLQERPIFGSPAKKRQATTMIGKLMCAHFAPPLAQSVVQLEIYTILCEGVADICHKNEWWNRPNASLTVELNTSNNTYSRLTVQYVSVNTRRYIEKNRKKTNQDRACCSAVGDLFRLTAFHTCKRCAPHKLQEETRPNTFIS